MSQDPDPPDVHLDAPTHPDIEQLELFRRSPHPYLKHQNEIRGESPERQLQRNSSGQQTGTSKGGLKPGELRPRTSKRNPSLPNGSNCTPTRANDSGRTSPYPHEFTHTSSSHNTMSDADGRKRRKTPTQSQSPSGSGTEADDEGYTFVKALPPPPLRPHKGLRDTHGSGQGGSPLLTPTQIDDEGRKLSDEYFAEKKKGKRKGEASFTDDEARAARQKYLKRRRMELVRRTTETALLAGIGFLAVSGCGCWEKLLGWHRELVTHASIIGGLLVLYPIRVFYYSWRRGNPSNLRLRKRIHVPAAFDPATILYPTTLPIIISISLFASYPKPLLPNILLSLAALPPRLIPFKTATLGYSNLHWLLSILPLIAAENTDIPSRLSAITPYKLRFSPPQHGLDPELLVTLFALHQALLPPLYYLTTTSLLPTELHLLSIGLINLLLFSESPQAGILKTLMWLGGVGLFVTCGNVLKWGVALARIPRWRLRRAGHAIMQSQSFLQILNERLRARRSQSTASRSIEDSDADDDEPLFANPLQKTKSLKISVVNALRKNTPLANGHEPHSAIEAKPKDLGSDDTTKRQRRNTLPVLAAQDHTATHRYTNVRKRSKSIAQSYLDLTPTQATTRKWAYAAYFYLIVVLIILGPIRLTIAKHALSGYEPFGWAIGYLFGNIPRLRWEVYNFNLESWIPLPPLFPAQTLTPLSTAEYIRQVVIGPANTRLLLAAYCSLTIVLGLICVLSLSSVVEVDTRRKVFHGTMVAMLLPTIFIDPCFVSLALTLVLAIFLLLDLIRASQLPPLSSPIARFLTPYVDGRDLRGPVVVSHIFLLVGCAIPVWLSLAGVERTGGEDDGAWGGWDVGTRDVSMLAGVVCVGMGDAAASLIGRRYGRRKWPWAGGKSLEGSLAFAVAVTIGLVFGKIWLVIGWSGLGTRDVWCAVVWMGKAALCAVGASLNEAVLTGGNDNVVVPVVLWVLVRGVGL